jgi:DNA-binding transcriptional LysR family regulator
MDTLLSLRVLVAVVEQGSFLLAAQQLGLSRAMASKHVFHLEKRLGTRLLNRNSRSLSLTESGQVYWERCRTLLEELDEAESSISQTNRLLRGTLKITVPQWLATDRFARILLAFRQRYPGIGFDLDVSGRFVNIVEEGFDLALRASAHLSPNLIARPLISMPFLLVAAPDYLARKGHPAHPDELEQHEILAYSLVKTDRLPLIGPAGELSVRVRPVLQSNNEAMLLAAAVAGMGLGLMPEGLAERDLESGRLVMALPEYRPPASQLFAVYASRRYLSAKVRVFIDFLAEQWGDAPASENKR